VNFRLRSFAFVFFPFAPVSTTVAGETARPAERLEEKDETLIDRKLLGDAVKTYLKSRFVQPCRNLFRPKARDKK
jgi:hypothetical protein